MYGLQKKACLAWEVIWMVYREARLLSVTVPGLLLLRGVVIPFAAYLFRDRSFHRV